MLVRIYVYIKTQIKSRAVDPLSISVSEQNRVEPSTQANRECDFIEVLDENILKAIEKRISKAEMNILDAMNTKLDAITDRIDKIQLHL